MLQLIVGIPAKPKPDRCVLYLDALIHKITERNLRLVENPEANCKDIHRQILFYGIRYFNLKVNNRERTLESLRREMQILDFLMAIISDLTPAELITVFPVDKTYDGCRWQVKDFFFTMECLRDFGMDNKIGDKAQEILWDYENMDLRRFTVAYLSVHSDAMKLLTGQSIGEAWADEMGLAINTMYLDEATGKQFMIDNTGKTSPVKKKIPRYLKLHKM